MLDLIYYTNEQGTVVLEVSEKVYKRLAYAGLAKEVDYKVEKLIIEGEEYEVNAAKLDLGNRRKLISFIERERHAELEILFSKLDDNPTIKEIRENFEYVKVLTQMYNLFKDESNIYFSYE